MPLAWLLSDLREDILDLCTAKQLVAVRAVSHDFRAAARAALDKPRFRERKEAAALHAQLLKAPPRVLSGFDPPSDALLTRLDEMARRYWDNDREVVVGTCVASLEWWTGNPLLDHSMPWNMGYVCAVHGDGTCDIDTCSFAGAEEVMGRADGVAIASVRPVWPAPSSMRSGMLAIQDWHPRAFAYFMYRLSAPRPNGLLIFNMLLTDVKGARGSGSGVSDEPSPPQTMFAAVCEWDSDVSYDGLARWLSRVYLCLAHVVFRPLDPYPGLGGALVGATAQSTDDAREEILLQVFDLIATMPVRPAARLFNLVYQGSVWEHANESLTKSRVVKSFLDQLIPSSERGVLEHFGKVLHLCVKIPNNISKLVDILWRHGEEESAEDMADCGILFRLLCFNDGDRNREWEVLTLNRINAKLGEASFGRPPSACPEKLAGHFLVGFFDYPRSASESPPRLLMEWLETTGDVSEFGPIIRECLNEEGLNGLVSHLDRWADDSMERAAELFVAWHADGGRNQAVWDLMDALQPPWWSSGRRANARRERLLNAVRALGIGRS